MMRTLVRKEIVSLAGFASVALLLGAGIDLIVVLVAGQPHDGHLVLRDLDGVDQELSVYQAAFALALGSLLLHEEQDRGTQGFLDALPVGRSHVFSAKVCVATCIVVLIPLSAVLLDVVAHVAFAGGAVVDAVPWAVLAKGLALQSVRGVVLLWVVLAWSFLRRIGWLLLGTLWLFLPLLAGVRPELSVLNPAEIGRWTLDGHTLRPSWDAVGVQGTLALVSLAVAHRLYVGDGVAFASRLLAFQERWVGRLVVLGLSVVGTFLFFALLGAVIEGTDDEDDDATDGLLVTESLRIGFDETDMDLAEKADHAYAIAAERLGLPAVSDPPIAVDARGMGAADHLAGTFSSNQIRLSLTGSRPPEQVLTHEVVHALLHRAAPSFVRSHAEHFSTYNEGMATWVTADVYGESVDDCHDRAAFAVRRNELTAEEAFDRALTKRRLGMEAAYPIGCSLWAVLAERDPDLPAAVVAAMSDEALDGFQSSRDAVQALFDRAGVSLDVAYDAWFEFVETREGRIDAWLSYPVPSVSLANVDGSDFRVVLSGEAPAGVPVVVRARRSEDAGQMTWRSSFRPPHDLSLRRVSGFVEVQLGYPVADEVLWMPFQRLPFTSSETDPVEDSLSLAPVVGEAAPTPMPTPEPAEVERVDVGVTWGTPAPLPGAASWDAVLR